MTDDHVKKTVGVYNSIAAQYAVQAETHAPEQERQRFLELVPKGGKVLDAGCGSGRDCAYFEHQGLEVTGIDLSESLLNIARKVAFNSKFIRMDLRKIDFPEASFDGIWCCAAILHLKRSEIPQVLEIFSRILKPGGFLYIQVKAGTKEGFDASESVPDKKRYYTYFSKDEVKDFVNATGFQVNDIYSYNDAERFSDRHATDWIVCFAQKPAQ